MHVFYTPEIQLPEFRMNESESSHAIRVLRLKEGDIVQLIDGKGGLFKAEIIEPSKKECLLRILETINSGKTPSFKLRLAVAPTKNMDRFQFLVEKAVEIGVDEIIPLLCDHSERKVLKNDKVKSTVIAAAKQSITAHIPEIHDLIPFNIFIKQAMGGDAFLAHCEEDPEKRPLKDLYLKGNDVTICIGPEGDFSSKEIQEARNQGYKMVSLSENRLRTETAAIVACHTINLINP